LVARRVILRFGDHNLDWDTVAAAVLVMSMVIGAFFAQVSFRRLNFAMTNWKKFS
jgi:hypothetical protein